MKVLVRNKYISTDPTYVTWFGFDTSNEIVPQGVYFYVIELVADGRRYIYNPYKKTHGITLKSVTGYYDKEKGEIRYTIPQAARVRIRVGLKEGGPLLITPLDWVTRISGTYSLKWDGMDASGFIDLSSHPRRNIVIFAYTLADNSIVVESDKHATFTGNSNRSPLFSTDLPLDRDVHARNYFKMSSEPSIHIEFNGGFKKVEKDVPILNGVVPVKITIAPEDRIAMENSRYEIMLYVDTVFLFEDEMGFSPFTYIWDTRGLKRGNHLLTVNVWSYDDNCGVATKEICIGGDE